MNTTPILPGEPFSEVKTQQIAEQFHRDGFVHIPGVLTSEEITALRDTTDRLFADPSLAERTNPHLADTRYIQVRPHDESGEELPFILRNTIELDPIFREMLFREPILSLAEAIVGEGCKFCGQNVLRNLPGLSIERWHVDGGVHFPLPEDVPRFDPRIQMQVLWITVQMALTDIETIDQGPHSTSPAATILDVDLMIRITRSLKGVGPHQSYVRQGISISKILSVGTVARLTDPIAHAISYSHSTLRGGRIGGLIYVIRCLFPKTICKPPMIACWTYSVEAARTVSKINCSSSGQANFE